MDFTGPIQIAAEDGERALKLTALVDTLSARFEAWEQWRKSYETTWEEIYRLYFTTPDKRKTSTRSTITVPIIFQVIEAAVPKVITSIFGNGEEFFDVVAVRPEEQMAAEGMKVLLTYQLNQADFMVKFVDFVKQLLLYGTSYFQVSWKVRRDWVITRTPVRKPETINGIVVDENHVEWVETKEFKVVERRPEIEVLDILDVFPDPEARCEDDAQGLFVRSWMSVTDVKNLGKGKFPVFANTEDEKLTGEDKFAESRQARYAARGLSSPPKNSFIEVLTYWGRYDLDGDGHEEKCQIVIANREVVLVARPNPFHHQKAPIVRCVFFPIPLEWYGIGLVEPVISNVHELWTLRRQRLDNVNLALNRMWKVNSLADVDLDALISAPNNIILTDNMDSVLPVETGDVTSSSYNDASVVQSDIENATTPRSIQGSPESGRLGRTAKGAQLIIGQALEKFAVGTKLVEELGIKRVLKMVRDLNLQFIDSDAQIAETYGFLFPTLVDPATNDVIPTGIQKVEDLRVDSRFKMVGVSDMIGTEGKINQLTTIFGTFAPYLSAESIESILDKIVRLMGLDPKEINISAVANKLGALRGEPTNPEQNAILGQVEQNGTQAKRS